MEKELVCWWCVHSLPQLPCIHLPVKYDDKLKRFTTVGNFCSWQCAKAYAIDMNTARAGEIQSYLGLMRKQTYGKYVQVFAAPKRQALACFGGKLTIEEFRAYGGVTEPPVVSFPNEKQLIQTVTSSVATRVAPQDHGRLKAIETATAETDSLKLKRSKPLARSASKLESTLGIIRKAK